MASALDLGKSLIETIGKAGGAELSADLGELLLDATLDNGLVKEVPVVGTLLKLRNISISVKEHLFVKKLNRFLCEINSVSKSDREAFAESLEDDPELKEKTGEVLISLIDRYDETQKSELLAKAFSAYIRDEITFEEFFRIGRAIDRCMISDLLFVHSYERATDAFPDSAFDLASCGLIEIVAMPTIRTDESKNMYLLTDFGRLLMNVVL